MGEATDGGEKDRDDLKFFLARFDLAKLHRDTTGGRASDDYHALACELEAKVKQGQDDRELKMLSVTFASMARACLSGRKTLRLAEVSEFVRESAVSRNGNHHDLDVTQEQYRVNSVAGGIAVLIVQHRAWLSQHPDIEKWCIDTLRELKPAETSDLDSSMSALDHAAESFIGEAGAAPSCWSVTTSGFCA